MSQTASDPIAAARQLYQDIWDDTGGVWDLRPWFEYLMDPEAAMAELAGVAPVTELFIRPSVLAALSEDELPNDDIAAFGALVPVRELSQLFVEVRDGQWKDRSAELVARFTELTYTQQTKELLTQRLTYSPEFQAAARTARALYGGRRAGLHRR